MRTALRPLYRRVASRVPSQYDNLAWNRKFWESFSCHWDKTTAELGRGAERSDLEVLGDEWGNPAALKTIFDEFLFPHIDREAAVAEIGVGGGRIARQVAPKVRRFYGYDISPRMIARTREVLGDTGELRVVSAPALPLPDGSLDFVYSYDVFVHLDLHTQWAYMKEIKRCLRAGGRAFLHTSNLSAPKGWEKFSEQARFSPKGFYFVCPEVVRELVDHAGLTVLKESEPDPTNAVLARDYLALLGA